MSVRPPVYFGTPVPRLFAHRGAGGEFPENTLLAFRNGIAQGADLLELDVHASADGEIVVTHDEDVSRTTSGAGLVRELSLDTIRGLDAGAGFVAPDGSRPHADSGVVVPTLREVLEEFPATPLNIEIKQPKPAIEADVLALLETYHAIDRVILAAEHHEIMLRIREAGPDWSTSFSADEVIEFHDRVVRDDFDGYRPQGCALQVPHFYGDIEVVTPTFVAAAHRFDLEVHVWTINDEQEMRVLLDLGVDALMSDFPARAVSVLDR